MNKKSQKVFISGKFRVIHSGHMRLFRTAKDIGNELIVALDIENLSEEEIHWRKSILENIEYVNNVILYKGGIEEIIREVKPDVVIKGHEFRNVFNEESIILAEYGGKLIFTSGAYFYSESDLIGSGDLEFFEKPSKLPQEFMSRNKISTYRLLEIIQNFSNLQVCVIGDLIIDEYINCSPLGMSQEEPTVVVTPVDKRKYFGGAGIVAAHCKALGAKTSLITVTGDDEISQWALSRASDYEIENVCIVDNNRPTTLKQRYRSGSHTLFKISYLSQDFLDPEKEQAIINEFSRLAPTLDVLIFSDFSYGVLSPLVVNQVHKIAQKNGIFIAADSQSSSQIGNLGKFRDIDLISATEREARLELKDNTSGLVVVAEGLRNHLGATNLLFKMGSDGVLISAEDKQKKLLATDEISALNKNPIDTSGAGDSMLAGASLALSSGSTIYEAALIGSVIAGIQVGKIGNVPIGFEALNRILHK